MQGYMKNVKVGESYKVVIVLAVIGMLGILYLCGITLHYMYTHLTWVS